MTTRGAATDARTLYRDTAMACYTTPGAIDAPASRRRRAPPPQLAQPTPPRAPDTYTKTPPPSPPPRAYFT